MCESLRLLCTDLVKKLFPVFPSMYWKFVLTLACAPSFSQSGHGSIESNLKITLLRVNPRPRLSPLLHRWLLALSVAVLQRGAAATSSASSPLRTRSRAKLARASECLTAATHAHGTTDARFFFRLSLLFSLRVRVASSAPSVLKSARKECIGEATEKSSAFSNIKGVCEVTLDSSDTIIPSTHRGWCDLWLCFFLAARECAEYTNSAV